VEQGKEGEGRKKGEKGGWQRLTLPRRFQRSTLSAHELNDRVRDGTGCTLTALATNTHFSLSCFFRSLPHCLTHTRSLARAFFRQCCSSQVVFLCLLSNRQRANLVGTPTHWHHGFCLPERMPPHITGRRGEKLSPRPLVSLSYTCHHASTCDLSNWWSPSGLTLFPDEGSHLGVGFPLRCFQRLSNPEFAIRRCRWRDNRHTSARSSSVLSY
jgi:hypothetical protein